MCSFIPEYSLTDVLVVHTNFTNMYASLFDHSLYIEHLYTSNRD